MFVLAVGEMAAGADSKSGNGDWAPTVGLPVVLGDDMMARMVEQVEESTKKLSLSTKAKQTGNRMQSSPLRKKHNESEGKKKRLPNFFFFFVSRISGGWAT